MGQQMAQRVVTLLVDDITGEESEDVTNVTFSVAGTEYEIDLNDANHDAFMKALAPYMNNGRRIKRGRRQVSRSQRSTTSPHGPSSADIREWAQSHGYEVSSRGRVPASVVEAFDKAR